jgi:hypothetical protein
MGSRPVLEHGGCRRRGHRPVDQRAHRRVLRRNRCIRAGELVNGSVDVNGIIVEEGQITVSGGTLNLVDSALVDVGDGLALDVNSVVAGNAGLIKTGGGILRLNTANSECRG